MLYIGNVAEEDIGIISPYHAQCLKLKGSLDATDRLKIGSVEEFQGQVRRYFYWFSHGINLSAVIIRKEKSSSFRRFAAPRTLLSMIFDIPLGSSRTHDGSTVNTNIIISHLNSNPSLLVAITRAQALLIIVGDPNVLSLDPLWRSFLNYVYLNGGWRGPDITWDPNEPVNEAGGYDKSMRKAASVEMEEFTKRMGKLRMIGMGNEGEWRGLE